MAEPQTGPKFGQSTLKCNICQGHCHKVLFGGGDKFMGTQIRLPPKSSLSSDFNHFILKLLENAKFLYVSRKKY